MRMNTGTQSSITKTAFDWRHRLWKLSISFWGLQAFCLIDKIVKEKKEYSLSQGRNDFFPPPYGPKRGGQPAIATKCATTVLVAAG